jgi:biofilm protein TabA
MVTDQLNHADRYTGLHPLFSRAFEYLARPDLEGLAAGTYELEGRRLYSIVQDYVTKPMDQGKWEAHRQYIDLQFVVRGTERIGYAPARRMEAGAYDTDRDFQALSGRGDFITLHRGDFVLLWPGEAHMPGMAAGDAGTVRKVVVKIGV